MSEGITDWRPTDERSDDEQPPWGDDDRTNEATTSDDRNDLKC
jgi:hypothetical protein